MIVYRYQDSKGFGPYNSNRYLPEMSRVWNRKNLTHRRPPVHNFDWDSSGKHLFGFVSIRQCRDWFNHEDHIVLMECGFRLIKFAVPDRDVRTYPEQCLFYTKNAYELGVYDEN